MDDEKLVEVLARGSWEENLKGVAEEFPGEQFPSWDDLPAHVHAGWLSRALQCVTALRAAGYTISPPGSVVLPAEGSEAWEEAVERIARVLCRRSGSDPDRLEPGNIVVQPGWHEDQSDWDETLPPDGHKRNGDPAHFMWRQHIFDAQAALRAAGGRDE